jgi:hypothetical protein
MLSKLVTYLGTLIRRLIGATSQPEPVPTCPRCLADLRLLDLNKPTKLAVFAEDGFSVLSVSCVECGGYLYDVLTPECT